MRRGVLHLGPVRVERWCLALLAALPFAAAPLAGEKLADGLGSQVARQLSRVLPRSGRDVPAVALLPDPDASRVDGSSAGEPTSNSSMSRPPRGSAGGPRREAAAEASPSPVTGLRVTAEQVLRLAERGAAPTAVPVRDPAVPGLALVGVSGLGLGLQDGDRLTHVQGQPVSAVSQVVGLVLAARARHAPVIHGQLWRRGQVVALSVEQPYLRSGDHRGAQREPLAEKSPKPGARTRAIH